MKTLFSSIAILLAITGFAQTTSETRTVGDFTGIRVASAFPVEITQGETCSVTIVGKANDTKGIKTEVTDGILSIAGQMPKSDDDFLVKVTVKNLRLLDVSGASSVTSSNQLIVDSLQVLGSGAASVKLDVKATLIKTNLSGASNARLSGSTSTLDAMLSGAAQLKSYTLAADKVMITTGGASSAHVSPTSSITAMASGTSSIHYQGNPTVKTLNASGTASVENREGETNSSDTTRFHVAGQSVTVVNDGDDDESSPREHKSSDESFEFWSGLDIGIAGYTTTDNKLELPTGMKFLELNYAKSFVFGLNIFQKNIHIYRNNVNLGTGIGATWYHYNFRNSYSLTPNVDYAAATYDSLSYKYNRLNMCYANIPLFLEFNTKNSDAANSFHFGAGIDFGYNIFQNKLKQKYVLNGHTYKRKQKDDFDVNPFRYDIIARVGYGKYTIFASYALSTLFEKDKGPVVYPISAGIHIDF
jgi:hypothetical protein